ncbi:MAG: beta-L-arabinofuranosidase domain-containing protein [Lacunisphaera sp.]
MNSKFFQSLAAFLALASCLAASVPDKLTPAAPGSIHLGGWLGEKIELCLDHRVMAQDVEKLIQPFRDRTEENIGHWRCEYWGKWFTSATLGYAYQPTPENRALLDRAIKELLATQTPDGYIGTYRADKHLGIWDVWGRKYTLLGLIADYDLNGNQDALKAAIRLADHLLAEAPPGKVNLTATGADVLKGLAPSSILEPIVLLYDRTSEKRYLELASDIVASWDKPNIFLPHGLQLEEQAMGGVLPAQIASPKAYEMMSCFEGLCELYRATGEKRHLTAAIKFAESIRRTEIMIHGSGSNHELWADSARLQTEILEQPVETCVTATWMKLCYQLLRITGDPVWADQMEVALYNALAGAMTPEGNWWAYFSPLSGQRVPSHYQHQDVQMSCCAANGPRGLLLTPSWSVMGRPDGIAVNLYSPGSARQRLADGTDVKLEQLTDYPIGDSVVINVTPSRATKFSLALRIPAWSKRASLAVNGQIYPCSPGTYAEVAREWKAGDQVVLQFDLRGRAVAAPSGAPQFAVMRGPVVLALDDRLVKSQDVAAWLIANPEGYVDLVPSAKKPAGVWMAFDVPFEVRPTHFFKHHQIALSMCDYASAGNQWSSSNLFRTWLPQPLFMRDIYPADTWRLMCPELTECPTIPNVGVVDWKPVARAEATEPPASD